MIVPVKKGGEPLTEEEYEALEGGVKAKVDEIGKQLQEKLNDIAREVREAEKNVKELLSKLEKDATLSAVGHYMEDLKKKYQGPRKDSLISFGCHRRYPRAYRGLQGSGRTDPAASFYEDAETGAYFYAIYGKCTCQ